MLEDITTMPKQKVPDIDFKWWVIAELPQLFLDKDIFINESYQRGDIWKLSQKIELLRSINNRYSIGVIVLFVNENNQYEVLDGQQRLLTIYQYLSGNLPLNSTEIVPYADLTLQDKTLLDAYCVYYIKLKSHDPDSKEEDIIQTFLRLQEGTPLNKAEKLNAYRGKFKDTFVQLRNTHPIFAYLGKEKRFRWRQLAAEILAIDLESDFEKGIFPSLDLDSMKVIVSKYEKNLSIKHINTVRANLDFLYSSLNILLTAFQPREFIAFYLLASYLRKHKANNDNLMNEFSDFTERFLANLSLFSVYDTKPPQGMTKKLFDEYRNYKIESKIMTTPDSVKKRFDIMLREYNRMYPFITKDSQRLFDIEQKRIMYFRQKGLCGYCGKKMLFRVSSGHHIVAHNEGGSSRDLEKAVLLHETCHQHVERQINKGNVPVFLFK